MDKLFKEIRIKGQVKKMDFEQCYCQFAPLRARLVKEFAYLPHCEPEDVKQLVDMHFYKAYVDYNIEKAEFITFAIKLINWRLKRLNRGHHAQKRQTYSVQISSLNITNVDSDTQTEIIESITDYEDITEDVILDMCIEKAFSNLDKTCVEINKLLMKGLRQQSIAERLGVTQKIVSRSKHKFLKELKKELSA